MKRVLRMVFGRVMILGRVGFRLPLAIALLALVSVVADARTTFDELSLDRWTVDDGLPQNSVNAIAQDSNGYLWIGSYEGIARFDGIRFEVFDMANTTALRSSAIWSLSPEREGRIWVGMVGGGLALIEDGEIRPVGGLEDANVFIAREDRDDVIWVGTDSGLFRGSREGGFAQIELVSRRVAVRRLLIDETGLWVGTSGAGLWRIEADAAPRQVLTPPDYSMISALSTDGDGGLWIGTAGKGLFHGDPRGELQRIEGLSSAFVQILHIQSGETLWAGTFGGGLCRVSERVECLGADNGLASSSVLSVIEDRDGSIWFGTDAGLYRLRENRIRTLDSSDGLAGDFVRVLSEDLAGTIWIGTDSGGLSRIEDGIVEIVGADEGLLGESIRSLHSTSEATWAGVYGEGVVRVEGDSIRWFRQQDGLRSPLVRAIGGRGDGSVLVGHESGLDRIVGSSIEAMVSFDGLMISSIFFASDGAMMVGSYGDGLGIERDGVLQMLQREDGLPSNVIFSVSEDDAGSIWICTQSGLARLVDGRVFSYATVHGLEPRAYFKALEDSSGMLWISTGRGLLRVDKAELVDVAEGRALRVNARSFDTREGMPTAQTNGGAEPAGLRREDGSLWFPTARGVVIIDPSSFQSDLSPPPVLIERFAVDGLVIDSAALVGPGVDRLEVSYAAVSMSIANRTRFRHRLLGLSSQWNEVANRREATFTNLDPGDYVFEIAAAHENGDWGEPVEFSFRVQPHFNQRPVFYVLVALALIGIGLAAQVLRVRRLRRASKLTLGGDRHRQHRRLYDHPLDRASGDRPHQECRSSFVRGQGKGSSAILLLPIQVAESGVLRGAQSRLVSSKQRMRPSAKAARIV